VDRQEIEEFIKEIAGPNTPLSHSEGWVSLPCVLSEWTHAGGADTHPSAGISVKPGGVSVFNCFTCHTRGKLSYLVRKLSSFTGDDYGGYAQQLDGDEFFGGYIPKWGERTIVETLPYPIDKQANFDLYDSAYQHEYVRSRGISENAALTMELLHDPGDGGEERILFPVYDRVGNLYGFSGRATSSSARLRVKDYYGLPKAKLLLGAHLVLPEDEFVILVEGLFDYAKLVTYGYPAMAFMSSTLTPYQAEIVKDIGKPVYFFHDNDKAGEGARDNAKELLWQHVPVMKVRYPPDKCIETPEGGMRRPKDPAELSHRQVEEMLADARLL